MITEEQKIQFPDMYETLVRTLKEIKTLENIVDETGYTYTAGDLIKQNPAVAQLREVQKLFCSLSTRFGLSPRDRQLLERDANTEEEKEDYSEFKDLDV